MRRIQCCILLLTMLLAGCRADDANVLHLYTSLDAQEAPVYIDAFQQQTGIDVQWVRLSAGETLARLEAEKNNPQVSLWFGGPSPEFIVAAQRGLLEPYQPQLDWSLEANAHGAAWEWTGFYFGAIGFACNTNLLREKQLQCPDSWEALLDPGLKGHISVAYPYTSGTAYVMVAALLEHFGEQVGWEYIRQLNEQVQRYNSSGSAAVTQVGMGEVAVGIAFAHDILKKVVERGYPVQLSIPDDGVATEIGAVAVVKGGRQTALAQQFIDWLLSKRAQNLLAQFYRVPLNPAATIAEGAVTARDVNAIPLDAQKAAQQQSQILAQWRQVTGR